MQKGKVYVSQQECRELVAERARAVRECPDVRLSDDGRYVVEPKSIRGFLRISHRDIDGSVVAAVRVCPSGIEDSPGYVRKLRITTQEQPSTRRTPFTVARG